MGTVINKESRTTLSNASVTFRIGRVTSQYPVIYTDTNGGFRTVLSLEQNYPLAYYVSMDNYVTKLSSVKIVGDSINLGIIELDSLIETEIFFCGKIIDSVTGLPISNVRIQLHKNPGSSNPFLELYTDSTGYYG
ncbi:MAG: hypothetical protein JNL74_21595, partial [Fibrobacteres bacterium]|nr:hypothetical protein [Fibrobacterota bacterium]